MEHLGLEQSEACYPFLEGWTIPGLTAGIYFLIEDPKLRAFAQWHDGPIRRWAESDELFYVDSLGLLFIRAY